MTNKEKIVFAIRLLKAQAISYGILTEVFIEGQVNEALAALDNLVDKED